MSEADEARLIAGSGLFDANHYLIEGPDVRGSPYDPIAHFCACGWREGRRPNPFFDPDWYRALHLGGDGRNPLAHYIVEGEAAALRPISYFDPGWYRRAHGLAAGDSPLAHYLAERRMQTVAPNPLFDLAFYLGRHGAEIGRNRDPFAHLLRCGAARDLDPSPVFDSAAYRALAMTPAADAPAGLAAYERRVPLVHHLDAWARREAAERRERDLLALRRKAKPGARGNRAPG